MERCRWRWSDKIAEWTRTQTRGWISICTSLAAIHRSVDFLVGHTQRHHPCCRPQRRPREIEGYRAPAKEDGRIAYRVPWQGYEWLRARAGAGQPSATTHTLTDPHLSSPTDTALRPPCAESVCLQFAPGRRTAGKPRCFSLAAALPVFYYVWLKCCSCDVPR